MFLLVSLQHWYFGTNTKQPVFDVSTCNSTCLLLTQHVMSLEKFASITLALSPASSGSIPSLPLLLLVWQFKSPNGPWQWWHLISKHPVEFLNTSNITRVPKAVPHGICHPDLLSFMASESLAWTLNSCCLLRLFPFHHWCYRWWFTQECDTWVTLLKTN